MKKKLFLIISLCLCMLGMTACSQTDPTTVDYNGVTYEQLQSTSENFVSTLVAMTEDEKAQYLANGSEETIAIVEGWENVANAYGTFVEASSFEVSKAGKTLTTTQNIQFSERPVVMSIVYNYNTMEMEGITFDPVQSLGEKMSRAGLNTVMGIMIVFCVLILISLIIYCFKLIPYFMERSRKKPEAVESKAEVKAPVVNEITEHEAVQQDDAELIAVIAAAIAAASGTSTEDFVVRSIKRR